MNVGLMVEGQNGLTWERWAHIYAMAERLGFSSLLRSDHYFIGAQQDSLEAFISLTLAARETRRIRLGPLVTPVTFRSPVEIGRMAAQIDRLSGGGRFVLGMGAGWNQPEHRAYGVPFPPPAERLDRLEEAIQVVRALWGPGPATFHGRYYHLENADCLPKPASQPLPLLIGGSGERRTLRLVAQYADEWNCVNLSPEVYAARTATLERHCEAACRDPATIRRSMMLFAFIGPDMAAIERLCRRFFRDDATPSRDLVARVRERGWLAGTTTEALDYLGRLAALGLQEAELQHLDFESDELPEYIAGEIMPALA